MECAGRRQKASTAGAGSVQARSSGQSGPEGVGEGRWERRMGEGPGGREQRERAGARGLGTGGRGEAAGQPLPALFPSTSP